MVYLCLVFVCVVCVCVCFSAVARREVVGGGCVFAVVTTLKNSDQLGY